MKQRLGVKAAAENGSLVTPGEQKKMACLEFSLSLMVFVGICRAPLSNRRVRHKVFLRKVRVQNCSSDTPGIPKNALGPVSISLNWGTSDARR